jgi:hypothetical protein
MPNMKIDALNFIRREGPIIPSQLSGELKTNLLLASAILSELSSKKEVNVTFVKKGGSPFYFVNGQEAKLEGLCEYLSGKPREAFNLLKEKKVIREKICEPWLRVALKEIKDYAVPLNVGFGGDYEIFWKWYLTDNDEAKELIKKVLKPGKSVKKEEKKEIKKEVEEKPVKEEQQVLEPVQKEIKQELEGIPFIVTSFFSQNSIYVISQEVVRKGKDFSFVADVPSNVGSLRYFVKYKDKKTVSDADLMAALDKAKKLPVLFLSNGTLTRKAEKYLNDNPSGGLVFRNV